MYLSELPSDLEKMDETLGPPPSWFQTLQGASKRPRSLGDRETEIEVNPLEELQNLKFKQEMNKSIPTQANRYTEIDPLSPMFRSQPPKFGFGEVASTNNIIMLVAAVVAVYLIFRANI